MHKQNRFIFSRLEDSLFIIEGHEKKIVGGEEEKFSFLLLHANKSLEEKKKVFYLFRRVAKHKKCENKPTKKKCYVCVIFSLCVSCVGKLHSHVRSSDK